MNRNFNQYKLRSWIRTGKSICRQLIIPFSIFQAVRTILFPSTLDIFLLLIFIGIALAFHYEFI